MNHGDRQGKITKTPILDYPLCTEHQKDNSQAYNLPPEQLLHSPLQDQRDKGFNYRDTVGFEIAESRILVVLRRFAYRDVNNIHDIRFTCHKPLIMIKPYKSYLGAWSSVRCNIWYTLADKLRRKFNRLDLRMSEQFGIPRYKGDA